MLVVITRAEPAASAMVARLRARGVGAVAAPAVRLVEIPGEPPEVTARRGQPTDVLVASVLAARVLMRQGVDPAWRVLATAPRTAAAVPGSVPVLGGGADLARAARGTVIALRSDVGGESVRDLLPEVIDWVAYKTTCPDRIVLPDPPYSLLVMSPSAIRNLEKRVPHALANAARIQWFGTTTHDALARLGLRGEPWRDGDPTS